MIPQNLQTIFSMSLFNIFKTGNALIDAVITTMMFSALNYMMNHMELFSIYNIMNYLNFDTLYSIYKTRNTIILEGDRIKHICSYDGTPTISNTFSNTFKALLNDIISNMNINNSIYKITEITDPKSKLINESYSSDYISYLISQPHKFVINIPLEIFGQISCVIETCEENKVKCSMNKITIEMFSYKSTIPEMKKFLNELTEKFISDISDKRINQKFIYDIKTVKNDSNSENCWTEHEFQTTRSFDNMFFDGKCEFLKKIDFFMKNKDWYYKMGIPYSIGIGLHGPPGTGKTSLIKSLAKYTNRHIINISLKMIKTRAQLRDFYYEMTYNNLNKFGSITFDQKIIVMEDIDCLGDIVFKRDIEVKHLPKTIITKSDSVSNIIVDNKLIDSPIKIINEDPITLDDILNLWDGIRETPGRILIISSNHYHKLDDALTRNGRIDIALEMSYVSKQTIAEMYQHFFRCEIEQDVLLLFPEKKYTPANIMNMYINSNFSQDTFVEYLTGKVNILI